jgi:hypothetical protein
VNTVDDFEEVAKATAKAETIITTNDDTELAERMTHGGFA